MKHILVTGVGWGNFQKREFIPSEWRAWLTKEKYWNGREWAHVKEAIYITKVSLKRDRPPCVWGVWWRKYWPWRIEIEYTLSKEK